ncbi:pyruvate:ferredoxin (flavodoxin) oxidoreductase [Desulfopila inferna]|uniref:pyruvate:ferredoxin (flavodoxin) oxidoreductase n=1 Tax=Desulfopila inferna TaxID=468528 RepID=UPI0019634545|nr:pyruvate:ferredoxin (flavodoxin) oxidoreductase [Desulfopila inferna]MBM9605271.1 pyruvate:ferredoxin (flavodoxin) oxidoreductase [Desulfopila inferna]
MESPSPRRMITVDANEAVAAVAYHLSEVIAIYPITPSSPMGEHVDEWSVKGDRNIWGTVPLVSQMQSEAGVAGAVHGSLQAGSLCTTFTASQGLLLMIPNMYKIAGELTPFAMHVTARTIATHALSIFGDHSDVMACRQTGFAMLASSSVQEAQDMAAIAHSATLRSRIPFLHFFDGFRTSHEVNKIEELITEEIRQMVDDDQVRAHRQRALNPDGPLIRGTAQNPDTFFQGREASNPFYLECPGIVRETMKQFGKITGRSYDLFEYVGDPQAEQVIVIMGSGAETVEETVKRLNNRGDKVGMIKVRLFRPFAIDHFVDILPESVNSIAVLDRTKEPGAIGEPLYKDVVAAIWETGRQHKSPLNVIGGRYGLSSKEFTPAMVKAVFEELGRKEPLIHFTVGIEDDVTSLSLPYDDEFEIEDREAVRALFFGLGSDGTVGANKNSIKIIGEDTPNHAQGYFVYDSKKSGSVTVSHLRFGPSPIRAPYLIQRASFIACHQFGFLERIPMLDRAEQEAVFLLNAPYGPDEVWEKLPLEVQMEIIDKKLSFYVIDAYDVADKTGMGVRINTIMQTCFFAISGILPREEAIGKIKDAIRKSYEKKGEEIVRRNFKAVDDTLANLHQIKVPAEAASEIHMRPVVPEEAPEFVQRITAHIMAGKGDQLPVSAFPVDGTWPVSTTRWEKRNIALQIPIWAPQVCIQCGKCSFVCPHATIRTRAYDPLRLEDAPEGFRHVDARGSELKGMKYTVQVAPEDCTGCRLCVMVCPGKDKSNPRRRAINMEPRLDHLETEKENYRFFLNLPEVNRSSLKMNVKNSQLLKPLFEYSGCCAGCGETQYIKLLTQLFGERALIANATGCSSIYGGNLPTTPYTTGSSGRGPSWSNSLFEDNAEFGLGFRLSLDKQKVQAEELLSRLATQLEEGLAEQILTASQLGERQIEDQREHIMELRKQLEKIDSAQARELLALIENLIKKSVWIVGGDGWAYDIGYGGLDHVLSLGRDINVLVLDTEMYSNTGGQQSKATPLGAAAKFAAIGKSIAKKELGLMAMTYGGIYVGRVAFGANDNHTVKVFEEAESFPGASLIIAYSHCIGQGFDLAYGARQQKLAVDSGYWPLYRYDPRKSAVGENPFILDSGAPKIPLREYIYNETRYRMLEKIDPERAKMLLSSAQSTVDQRYDLYNQLAGLKPQYTYSPHK